MKKRFIIFALLLSFSLLLSGCPSRMVVVPDNISLSQPRIFEKDGIRLTLTNKFAEQKSEVGFYAYYVTDFCGVTVLREEFTLEEGLAECPIEEYTRNVIANNGYKNIEPQTKDGLWFYVSDKGATCSYSFSFKGSDAFWVVQFLCMSADAPKLEDQFFLWAKAIEVE